MTRSPTKKPPSAKSRKVAAKAGSTKHKVEKADVSTAKAVAPIRKSWPIRALGAVSELADQPPLITITATLGVIGLVAGERRLARAGARMLAAELLATWIKTQIKSRVDRTRPYVVVEERRYSMKPGNSHASKQSSFPSGHTAGAVAVARALGREYPSARSAVNGVAAGVAMVQVPRCTHFLSDIAAGAVVGLVAEAGVDLIVRGGDRLIAAAR